MDKKLYNKIMQSVSKQVRKAINEQFVFEHNETGDKIVDIIKGNDQIMAVVKEADIEDYKELLSKISVIENKDLQGNAPKRIQNIRALAFVIAKALGNDIRAIKFLQPADMEDLAEYIMEALHTEDENECNKPVKECNGKDCKKEDVKECGDVCPKCGKKPCECKKEDVKESAFTKFNKSRKLNEGFASWREENRPKFDTDRFKACSEKLVSIIKGLAKDNEVGALRFIQLKDGKSTNIVNIEPQTLAIDKVTEQQAVEYILKSAKEMFRDDYAKEMQTTYFAIEVNPDRYLMKYIKQEINPGTRREIQDKPYIKFKSGATEKSYLVITSMDLISEFNGIIEFFS